MTPRITIFGITTSILGLIGGSVLSGGMTALIALGLMVVLAALFHINRALDRREHLKQLDEIESVEATFLARVERAPSTPTLSVINGGRLQ